MITGTHILIYSTNPEADRAFFRDVLDFRFVDLGRDTLRPYMNSVVVALASTVLAVFFGSLAAYALVRLRFQVKIAAIATFILLLAATIAAVILFSVPWHVALGVAFALFLLFLGTMMFAGPVNTS